MLLLQRLGPRQVCLRLLSPRSTGATPHRQGGTGPGGDWPTAREGQRWGERQVQRQRIRTEILRRQVRSGLVYVAKALLDPACMIPLKSLLSFAMKRSLHVRVIKNK